MHDRSCADDKDKISSRLAFDCGEKAGFIHGLASIETHLLESREWSCCSGDATERTMQFTYERCEGYDVANGNNWGV